MFIWLPAPVVLRAITVGKKGHKAQSLTVKACSNGCSGQRLRSEPRAMLSQRPTSGALLPPSDPTPKGSAFPDGDQVFKK